MKRIYIKETEMFLISVWETDQGFIVREWNKAQSESPLGSDEFEFESESGANLKVIELLGEWIDALIQVNNDNNN